MATKVHVTVKSVEAANAKLQINRSHGQDRSQSSGSNVIKPVTPSRAAIAEAGQRALESFKR